jgi:hypothetical protein
MGAKQRAQQLMWQKTVFCSLKRHKVSSAFHLVKLVYGRMTDDKLSKQHTGD